MSGLSALYGQCIFRSGERTESHALVATELSDHHLRWQPGRVDTQLYKFDTPRLSLYSLRYGAEVGIFPRLYDGFSLVHFSLAGGIEVEADGITRRVPQGSAVISSPRRNIRLRWSEASEQLILRLPHALLQQTAQEMGRAGLYDAFHRDPGRLLTPQAAALWQNQLQSFVALEAARHRSRALDPWLLHLEQGLALFLLLQGAQDLARPGPDGPTPDRPAPDRAADKGARRRRLDRMHDYALAHLGQPVTLADLARAAALSERQLNTLCHAELGRSPMVWLRDLRLDAIRRSLQADPGRDLADLAMEHGFFHLGRFAAFYRDRFGELPSQTLRTARSG